MSPRPHPTVHLVRHGQSAANAGLATSDNALIPLTPLGEQQALWMAEALGVAAPQVIVSSYLRAQQTAAPFCAQQGLSAQVQALLHEFVTLDPASVAGSTNVQRAPLVQAYWDACDPDLRHGPGAETFRELSERVAAVEDTLPALAPDTVVFGHGLWFALLIWRQLGFTQVDTATMRAFRQFQLALPMPNCAVYHLHANLVTAPRWQVQANEALIRRMSAPLTERVPTPAP
jgi:broad specificity phosphatase PhoE